MRILYLSMLSANPEPFFYLEEYMSVSVCFSVCGYVLPCTCSDLRWTLGTLPYHLCLILLSQGPSLNPGLG